MNIHTLGTSPHLSLSHAIDEAISSMARRADAWLVAAFDRVLAAIELRRDRATLARMSDRELKDLGLTRSGIADAAHEYQRRA